MTLTLQQVKTAGLPATTEAVGKYGSTYTVDYLPGNPKKERFRVTGSAPYRSMTFGPGGPKTPQDGWRHEDGCECEFCNTESEATP